MSLSFYSVAVPVTRSKLTTLIAAQLPTVSMGNVTTPAGYTPRGRQITIQSNPGNTAAAFIYIGNFQMVPATPIGVGAALAPGASWNYGNGSGIADALSDIYVQASGGAGADTIYVSVTD